MKFSREFNFANCRFFFCFAGTNFWEFLCFRLYHREEILTSFLVVFCWFRLVFDERNLHRATRDEILLSCLFYFYFKATERCKYNFCMLSGLGEPRCSQPLFALWQELLSSMVVTKLTQRPQRIFVMLQV